MAIAYDLLFSDILPRLPVKSLVRFKSISKQWQSLISDPRFSGGLSPDTLGLVVYNRVPSDYEQVFVGDNSINISPLNNPFGSRLRRIVNVSNGLMLMSLVGELDDNHEDYCIYNPTTRQSVALPPLSDEYVMLGLNLAFDPTKSPHYQVVYVRVHVLNPGIPRNSLQYYGMSQIEIYSSQTRSWRASGQAFSDSSCADFQHGVFCNGVIHWLNAWGVFSLYFNVEDEKLGKLRLPFHSVRDRRNNRGMRQLFESRGHLHLFEMYQTTQKLCVYEIESDCSGWFVKYQVDLHPLMVAFPEMEAFDYKATVVGVVREANEEESYMVMCMHPFIYPSMAVRFYFKDGSFRKICDWILNPSVRTSLPYSLIQTLLPL